VEDTGAAPLVRPVAYGQTRATFNSGTAEHLFGRTTFEGILLFLDFRGRTTFGCKHGLKNLKHKFWLRKLCLQILISLDLG